MKAAIKQLFQLFKFNITKKDFSSDIIKESWVRCYPDYNYEVSDLGRVRLISGFSKNGKPTTGGIRKQTVSGSNLTASLSGKNYSVNKLVYYSFHNKVPQKHGREIIHVNGDRSDNRLCNLKLRSEFAKPKATPKSNLPKHIRVYNYPKDTSRNIYLYYRDGKTLKTSIRLDKVLEFKKEYERING